jgi:hypothetical protein
VLSFGQRKRRRSRSCAPERACFGTFTTHLLRFRYGGRAATPARMDA